MIFVFGSNLAGRHGKGAALHARQRYGAIYGQGVGLQGRSYGIPTKDGDLNVLPIEVITPYVNDFIRHAESTPDERYLISRIGCGLAGYDDEQIAPLFYGAPSNCQLPPEWEAIRMLHRSGDWRFP